MAVSLPTVTSKPRSRFALRWYSWLLLVGAIVYGVAWAMHWDDRGVLWVVERFESPAKRQASVWLPDYRAVIDAKRLPGMEKDEASDLSYNPQTKTLFSVMGKNPFLVELTLQGDVLRKMPLNGWNNPEGVTVMENGLMAVVDERQHSLTIVKVDASTTALNKADFPSYDLGPSKDQNKAFEGVTWDKRNQQFVLGEERPPALFTWKGDGTWRYCDNELSENLGITVPTANGMGDPIEHLPITKAVKTLGYMTCPTGDSTEAIQQMNLKHAVITSVNRDERADGGASIWAETINKVKELNPGLTISAGARVEICPDASPFLLTGGFPLGGTWTGPGLSGADDALVNTSLLLPGENKFIYCLSDPNFNACKACATKIIYLNAAPIADFILPNNICLNTTFSPQNKSVGGNEFRWTTEENQNSDKKNPSFLFQEPGLKNLKLEVKNDKNCRTNKELSFNVSTPANINITLSDDESCAPYTVSINKISNGLGLLDHLKSF